jgi:hypothetical protein
MASQPGVKTPGYFHTVPFGTNFRRTDRDEVLDYRENSVKQSLLLTGLDHSDFGLRSASACYLWKVGEQERCFPILKAALESVEESGSQSPLHFTGRLGPAAGDLAPAIQPLLFHKYWAIRHVAGKTLKQIAPETLPPVREKPF